MRESTSSFDTPDGCPIHIYHWRPEAGDVRGIVQISHGLAEHAGRYRRFAEALTGAGYAVVANDHRGHGRSVRSPSDLGHFADRDGWTKAVEDIAQVSAIARSADPGVPLALFGHSMGSSLALTLAWAHPGSLDALVMSGPTGIVGPLRRIGLGVARVERLRLGRRGRSQLLQKMSFGDFNKPFEPARTPFDWLSRDPAEVDAYVSDPLCGFMPTTQHWRDHLVALGDNAERRNLDRVPKRLPILVVAGDSDPVSGGTKQIAPMLALLERVGIRRVDHRYWAQGRHELLNDVVRDDVSEHVLHWLDDYLPG